MENPAGPENTKLEGEGHTEKTEPRKRSRLRFRKAKRKTSNGIHLRYLGGYIGFRKLYFSLHILISHIYACEYMCVCVCLCVMCVCSLSNSHVDLPTEASQPIKEPVKKKGESKRAERLLAAGQKIKHVLVSR